MGKCLSPNAFYQWKKLQSNPTTKSFKNHQILYPWRLSKGHKFPKGYWEINFISKVTWSIFKYINLGNQRYYKKYNQKRHDVEHYDGKWKHKFCWYFDLFPEIMLPKHVFSFSIIVVSMMKLLVIRFITWSIVRECQPCNLSSTCATCI